MTGHSQKPSTSKSTDELRFEIPDNLETTLSDHLCIYDVPRALREAKPSAYTPLVVSIGPIHHGNRLLQKMETQKLRYLVDFCKRRTETEKQEDQERIRREFEADLFKQIDEDETRHYYADGSHSVTDHAEFVKMILLDSVFIIELFLKNNTPRDHQNDFIMGKSWLSADVENDLILLENQIPFSVLEKIYNFAMKTMDRTQSEPFIDLASRYFNNFNPTKTRIDGLEKILHFTDLVRRVWVYGHPKKCGKDETTGVRYSITKLCQAGLKLEKAKTGCYLDVNFEGGMCWGKSAKLQMPSFEVYDTTDNVVRNLMALEQCHYPDETYVCNFIRLLDQLINTAEDVDLLVDKAILVNGLGDDRAVAKLVNNLCNQIVVEKSCYMDLAVELNRFYESCGNHTMARLRSVYFGDVWRGTGTVAAVVLLVLTLVQTVCSILQL